MKKERDIRLYLDDILEAIEKIEKYTDGLDFEQFRKDDKTGDAVIRNFSVIGEAVKNISPDIRKKYPDILVKFQEPVGLFKFMELEKFLGKNTGIKVDIVSKKALKPRIGKYILEEVINI